MNMGKQSKDKRDVYNRLAKEGNWRARSVFKLLQVDEEMDILSKSKNVVDLCAAPGSWSQALQKIVYSTHNDGKIVAVDLQKIEPISGVITLIGDITKESTALEIIKKFGGKLADVVVCDGAADITGIHSLDESFHYFIFTAALAITSHLLVKGGHFVIKIFKGIHSSCIINQLSCIFKEVRVIKPIASRYSSAESFLVAKNYIAPPFFKANLSHPDMLLVPNCSISYSDEEKIDHAKKLLKYVMYGGFQCENDIHSHANRLITPTNMVIEETMELLKKIDLKNSNSIKNISISNINSLNLNIIDIRKKALEIAIRRETCQQT